MVGSVSDLNRVLLIRLRSIGDTVLMTPCLTALKRWKPELEVDVLIESLSSPVLKAHPEISHLHIIPKSTTKLETVKNRLKMVLRLRSRRYDAVFNLHGGTTATFIARLTGAPIRVGYQSSQYSTLLSVRAPSPDQIWQKEQIHAVEQQLALLKWVKIPVDSAPALSLAVEKDAELKIEQLKGAIGDYAFIHPAAAFESKQWPAERFAKIVDYLKDRYSLHSIVAVAPDELKTAEKIERMTISKPSVYTGLQLSELMALISKAKVFVGNDSGPAHIAAAFAKPLVVIFGSSNIKVWYPWSQAPFKIVRADMACAPCAGYFCSQFPEPECIKKVKVDEVITALDELLHLQSEQQLV